MPKKIIAYRMIRNHNSASFNDKVNEAIAEGYQPLGEAKIIQPVAITDHASQELYESQEGFVQTMVMYSDLKD